MGGREGMSPECGVHPALFMAQGQLRGLAESGHREDPGPEGKSKGVCTQEEGAAGKHPQNSANPGLGLPLLN